jgi:hypothetical protein
MHGCRISLKRLSVSRLLGQQIVAYMVEGESLNSADNGWVRGEGAASSDSEQRLQTAYQVFRLISMADSEETARAWFIGMNPFFADRAPFAVLGENPSKSHEVREAAKAFVVNG